MVAPLLSLGTLAFFPTLVFLLIPFILSAEAAGGGGGQGGGGGGGVAGKLAGGAGAAGGAAKKGAGAAKGTAKEGLKAAKKLKEGGVGLGNIVEIISDILKSPFAPIFIIIFMVCCCCCCLMVLNMGGSGDKIMEWMQGVPIIGESMSAIANIYIPLARAELQESGLGPYLIEAGPFGEQGYFKDMWTIFQNPWVMDWETSREEEVNPIYDRGIIIDDIDMIPSQPMSKQKARIKITVRNTEQDVAANNIKFFVANNAEVQDKTRLNFEQSWSDDVADMIQVMNNCYYAPCGDEDEFESPDAHQECLDNEVGRMYTTDRAEPGPCCPICGDVVSSEGCDACLELHNEVTLKKPPTPHLYPLDTVSLVDGSKTPAAKVTRHEDVSMHSSPIDIIFEYDFEPQTNIFCTNVRGMGKECTSFGTGVFNEVNEKEMSAYTFTIIEPGDYTEQQLLDWESQLVNYIAGGPVKVHVVHRKKDIYYRENPIFLHYKIENRGSDTDATEFVTLNPSRMRIIIPSDLKIDPVSEEFVKCTKPIGKLYYEHGDDNTGYLESPWICTPIIGGGCFNYVGESIAESLAATSEQGIKDLMGDLDGCNWAWRADDQRIQFFEGGNIEIPLQIDTLGAVTDREYTISLVFLGDKVVTGGMDEIVKSAYNYRLLESKVIAVQPTSARTVQ